MLRRLSIFLFAFISVFLNRGFSQSDSIPVNEYGLPVIDTYELYERRVAGDSTLLLVNLQEFIPGISLDLRYATENNFTGKVIYRRAEAFLRIEAAKALRNVEKELNDLGLGLKVYDAYRPYSATLEFYDIVRDTLFVATPWGGSKHNRGCAVDVTLIDYHTKKELPMPTSFDDFSEKAAPGYMLLADSVLKNRELLMNTMSLQGFSVNRSEWWHYDFMGWENYPVMDLEIEELMPLPDIQGKTKW